MHAKQLTEKFDSSVHKVTRLERRNKLLLVAPVDFLNIVLSKRNQEESQLTMVNFVLVVTCMENALLMVSIVVCVITKIILQSVAGRQLTKLKMNRILLRYHR